MRKVSLTLVLNRDQWTSVDKFQDFDANNNPISGSTGCNIEMATRQ